MYKNRTFKNLLLYNSTYLSFQTSILPELKTLPSHFPENSNIQSSHPVPLMFVAQTVFQSWGHKRPPCDSGRQHLSPRPPSLATCCPVLTFVARCLYPLRTNRPAPAADPWPLQAPSHSLGIRVVLSTCGTYLLFRSQGLSGLLAPLSHLCTPLKDTESFLYSSTLLQG